MESDAVSSNMEEKKCSDIEKDFGQEMHSDQEEALLPLTPSASLNPISLVKSYKFSGSCSTISGSSLLFLGDGNASLDGSNIDPVEEALLALEREVSDEENNSEENADVQDVFTLSGSDADEPSESWWTNIECAKNSPASENSVSAIGTWLESPRNWDLDRTSFYLSLLNLDGEDSKWISDEEADFDFFRTNFPSPSFRSYLSRSSSSRFASACLIKQKLGTLENAPAASDLEEPSCEDPIFWPFERNFDWASWDCFTMSPRRGINIVGSRVSNRNINLNQNGWGEDSLVIGSSSAPLKLLEHKQRNLNRSLSKPNTKSKPSRLQKSTKASAEVVPLDTEDNLVEKIGKTIFEGKPLGVITSYLNNDLTTGKDFLEETPIESLVGLPEFDGHEGVDFEFSEEDFFLD